jgi:5'-3' exoribonuclease 1
MGVPKFFRWATDRYPAILSNIIDDKESIPEVDYLYLDMNGIIHTCSHNNTTISSESLSIEIIIQKILIEINNFVELIQPKELLYIAIDGVAPRAKLNQQRSRRFRAAKDRSKGIENAIKKGLINQNAEIFDSSCITPGTDFMFRLCLEIQLFVQKQLVENRSWRNLAVYFSGSDGMFGLFTVFLL